MTQMRTRLSWSVLMLLPVILARPSLAAGASEAERQQTARFGEAIYSLYVDDPLTSLSKMSQARQQGLSDTQNMTLSLMEGGVALHYGMPRLAAQQLNQLSELKNNRQGPLALYWLARLNFSQGRLAAGIDTYDALLAADPDTDSTLLTPSLWHELHYQAAEAAMRLGRDDSARFGAALPPGHIGHQYLAYNHAVAAYQQNDFDTAMTTFQRITDALHATRAATQTSPSWFDWSSWWAADDSEPVSLSETDGLLDQVYLSKGLTSMAQGYVADALDALANISGNALIRDEALLHYGWGLANQKDWPMAMGVWDFLAKQPANLYTLQARHALAIGYIRQGGEVQALEVLTALADELTLALGQAERVRSAMQQTGYWQKVAGNVHSLDDGTTALSQSAGWDTLWPGVHQDVLIALLLKNNTQQDNLAQLETLYAVDEQLEQQHRTLNTFAVLLDERDATHARRASEVTVQPHEERVKTLRHTLNALKSRVDAAARGLADPTDDQTYISALATYADEVQLGLLARLERASSRYQRLAQARTLRPSYAKRLSRLKGIVMWQLTEQSNKAQWQHQQALSQADALLDEALVRQSRFTTLLAKNNVTGAQRERVALLSERVRHQQTTTRTLISALETTLTQQAMAAIDARHDYLTRQLTRSRLAILQLQDRWRGASEGTVTQRTTDVEAGHE
ncbi:tetratricopeptide repeat protein [Alteromonas sp. CYL-A6]|uniref:tetratricopeptide repeat protein n=1 Tax=Alteromonas nitratireducens TaxID=3390813 RepID=UPI0034B26DBB